MKVHSSTKFYKIVASNSFLVSESIEMYQQERMADCSIYEAELKSFCNSTNTTKLLSVY